MRTFNSSCCEISELVSGRNIEEIGEREGNNIKKGKCEIRFKEEECHYLSKIMKDKVRSISVCKK